MNINYEVESEYEEISAFCYASCCVNYLTNSNGNSYD